MFVVLTLVVLYVGRLICLLDNTRSILGEICTTINVLQESWNYFPPFLQLAETDNLSAIIFPNLFMVHDRLCVLSKFLDGPP